MSPSPEPKRTSVLLICHTYPPVLGGSEIEAQRVASALIRRGHSVTVVCAGGGPMPEAREWVDSAGVPVRTFGRGNGRPRDIRFALGVAWTLLKRRRDYDVAYFLMQGLHLAAGLPVARWLRKPVVMKISGSGIIPAMRRTFLGRMELRWLRRWARRVMVLNPGMVEEACQSGFDPSHLLWMPNPVDVSEFAPLPPRNRAALRERLGVAPESMLVVYAGRLAPEKELCSLIEAVALLRSEAPQMRLALIGDGPSRAELEEKAVAAGIDGRVTFTGRVTVEQVRDWMQAGDAFALVSSNEGFPCSLIEAMAAGLPSVVSDIPANLQLIDHGVHGLQAPVGSPEAIAGELARLARDPTLRARMGFAARQRIVENYSTDKVLEKYEALFEEARAGTR